MTKVMNISRMQSLIGGAAVAVCMALPLSAVELTHRWSFNGDYSDSVGGVDAVKCGTYVSLYGGRVHMGYGACSHGTGYVDLGTNMLDTTAATIEIWARHDGVENWSRVFDCGARRHASIIADAMAGRDLMERGLAVTLCGDYDSAVFELCRVSGN